MREVPLAAFAAAHSDGAVVVDVREPGEYVGVLGQRRHRCLDACGAPGRVGPPAQHRLTPNRRSATISSRVWRRRNTPGGIIVSSNRTYQGVTYV